MTRAAAIFFADTSCIIAVVCAWHKHHPAAAAEIERRLDAREHLATAAHALAEAYAVLTRFPAPHRLAPSDALAVLEGNFLEGTHVIALDSDGYRSVLRRAGREGISGGRTYDALIGECAVRAKAAVLLTFNAHHFSHLEASGVRVVVPAVDSGG
jgi:predicted nucleic acid-binding protein